MEIGKQAFNFLGLPTELQFMVFDTLVPEIISLKKHRKKEEEIACNNLGCCRPLTLYGDYIAPEVEPVAPIFILLRIDPTIRSILLEYIRHKQPIFSLSIRTAGDFPSHLARHIRRLELRRIEFDYSTIDRHNNPDMDILPTNCTQSAMRRFGKGWINDHIEKLTLAFSFPPPLLLEEEIDPTTDLTIISTFAPLALERVGKLQIRVDYPGGSQSHWEDFQQKALPFITVQSTLQKSFEPKK